MYLYSFVNEILLSETKTNATAASRRIPTTLILENNSLCPLKWLSINLKDVWQLCTIIYLWNIQPKDDVYVWMNSHKEVLILWLSVIIRQCYYQTTSKCENIRILSLMEGCAACGGLTRNQNHLNKCAFLIYLIIKHHKKQKKSGRNITTNMSHFSTGVADLTISMCDL